LKRVVTRVLVAAALAFLALNLAVFFLESRLVYFPGPPPEETPADWGLAYEDVRLETSDGVSLSAWFIPAAGWGDIGTVVFSHGNAGNIAARLPGARAFVECGLSVMLYDYRGYGASEGHPSEEGTYLDALAAYDWVVKQRGVAPMRVLSYGESLGGAVAIELARRRPVGAVFVESTFTSLPDVGARIYPFLPVRLLATIRYASVDKVGKLGVPLLVAHSREDEIVPFELGRKLFTAAAQPKAFLETGGGHNEGGFVREQDWRDAVGKFARLSLHR
jgi:fermentation-respiration switch protein FrsA (DUF1100 family)